MCVLLVKENPVFVCCYFLLFIWHHCWREFLYTANENKLECFINIIDLHSESQILHLTYFINMIGLSFGVSTVTITEQLNTNSIGFVIQNDSHD